LITNLLVIRWPTTPGLTGGQVSPAEGINWTSALLAIQKGNVINVSGAGSKTLNFAWGTTTHKSNDIYTLPAN